MNDATGKGEALFHGDVPSTVPNSALSFCEEYELAGQRTAEFTKVIQDNNLLIDGEISVEVPGRDRPFIYRGFQMISEDRLRGLENYAVADLYQRGMLTAMIAHLMSLSLVERVFGVPEDLEQLKSASKGTSG